MYLPQSYLNHFIHVPTSIIHVPTSIIPQSLHTRTYLNHTCTYLNNTCTYFNHYMYLLQSLHVPTSIITCTYFNHTLTYSHIIMPIPSSVSYMHSYDLTLPLQCQMRNNHAPSCMKYVWNEHLLQDLRGHVNERWILHITHGFIGQYSILDCVLQWEGGGG